MLNVTMSPEAESFGLTTAQITYRMPDQLDCFQDFLWQEYDMFPQFPSLRKFLAFWELKIEGPLHSIRGGEAPARFPIGHPPGVEALDPATAPPAVATSGC